MAKFYRVGAGWDKTGKNGPYVSFAIGDKKENLVFKMVKADGSEVVVDRLMLYTNDKKEEGSNHPDYRLVYISDEE